jgi:vanillate O-demethylase ferredoxin subunit
MRYRNIWKEATVVSTMDVAANVRQFEIAPAAGTQPYGAGAHLDISLPIHEKPEIRSYSLVGSYEPNRPYRIAVKRLAASRGGSVYMWSLARGARLSIAQPQNHFPLTFGRPSYILMAGGIGITPIYGMALELAERGADVRLLYAGASRADMPYVDELKTRLGERLSIHASDERARMDIDRVVAAISPGAQLYVCGPLRMLDAVRRAWHAHGLPAGDLRYETFGASGQFAPQPFRVSLPRLGLELVVSEHQSLLDALVAAGAEVMADCLRGECGLCAVSVLDCSGVVDHRDLFFSDAQKGENKKMCACVSRIVNGGVVIDTAYRGSLSRPIPTTTAV